MDKHYICVLDVDGVISFDGHTFDAACMDWLAKIVNHLHAFVVISSSRRNDSKSYKTLIDELGKRGIVVIGRTDDLPIADDMYSDRVDEIFHWVKLYNWKHWIVIDDLPLLNYLSEERGNNRAEFEKRFVKVDIWTGITEETFKDVYDRFKPCEGGS